MNKTFTTPGSTVAINHSEAEAIHFLNRREKSIMKCQFLPLAIFVRLQLFSSKAWLSTVDSFHFKRNITAVEATFSGLDARVSHSIPEFCGTQTNISGK